jgi:hypothetical protein
MQRAGLAELPRQQQQQQQQQWPMPLLVHQVVGTAAGRLARQQQQQQVAMPGVLAWLLMMGRGLLLPGH